MRRRVAVTINGTKHEHEVEPRMLLVQYIRDVAGLTGTHVGCDTSNCGACTVELDGHSVKSCTVFAVQADGAQVTTIEGLANGSTLHPLQKAFWDEHGLQCGFCTPGRRSDWGSRATSAAVPATTTSSSRSRRRPR